MDVPTLSRLHERNCSQPNPSGRYGDKNLTSHRVLATNPNSHDGDDLGSVYTNWGPDQPDFTVGACVELTERGLWRTADCNELKHFLCETQPASTTPASTWTAIVDEPRSPPSSGKEEALAFPALFSSAMADNDWSLSSTNDSTEHQAIHTDVAAGATMGGLILVVIVCLAILIFVRKKKGSLNSRVTLKASAEMTYPHRDRPSATWDGVRCSEETAVRVPASDLWQVGGGINETEMVENEVYNQALHGDAPQEACVMVDNELYGHL